LEERYRKRVLVALGGNAILQTHERGDIQEQIGNLENTSRKLAQIVASWYEVVITHGNGPQVGSILVQNEWAQSEVPPMPLDVCGAQSQGQIGYLLDQILSNELRRLGKHTQIATLVTQVLVDPKDPAFDSPTKPIGPWVNYEAMKSRKKEGSIWIEQPEKGWRQVVPSPMPVQIVNVESIMTLLRAGFIVVACGGGGVPVAQDKSGDMYGIEAVIDKDLSSMCLASGIRAHILMMLTDVPSVFLNFGTDEEKPLGRTSVSTMKKLIDQNAFPAGTIGPKVEAAVQFVEKGGERAVIANLEQADKALKGEAGTIIVKDSN
jgi:carbamate kinase